MYDGFTEISLSFSHSASVRHKLADTIKEICKPGEFQLGVKRPRLLFFSLAVIFLFI